jgi:hypothetical protein
MWALLTVGQRHAIGQNSVVVLAQRKLEQILEELGEICRNSCNVRGAYGAQFWLNAGGKFPCARDMFYCSGFQGQMVAIIPSLDLVIVRWA